MGTKVFDFLFKFDLEWRSYKNVELSSLYLHPKFERNRPVNVWIHANTKVILFFYEIL